MEYNIMKRIGITAMKMNSTCGGMDNVITEAAIYI